MKNKQAVNVMIDIETLGTKPGCSILSIAAVPFYTAFDYASFYVRISRESNESYKLQEDPATLVWWSRQSEAARQEAFSGTENLRQALIKLNDYLFGLASEANIQVWGNGASFDIPLIEAAQAATGVHTYWKYYNSFCYRTLKNLYSFIPADANKAAHNALADAKVQAAHAHRILSHLYGAQGRIENIGG